MFSLAKENIKIALSSIRSQLLRTILTVIIITIGITALVGILSAINALENTISSDFASMGANTFNLQRYDFTLQTRSKTISYYISTKELILEVAKELLYQERMKDSVRLLGISLSNLNTDKKEKIDEDEKEVYVQLKFEF